MPIQGLYKDMLDLTCITLGTHFERPQIHLPTIKQVVITIATGIIFLHGVSKLLCMLIVIISYIFHLQFAVICIFEVHLVLFKFLQTIQILI